MIAGWLIASTQSAAGGVPGGLGIAAAALAAAWTRPAGIGDRRQPQLASHVGSGQDPVAGDVVGAGRALGEHAQRQRLTDVLLVDELERGTRGQHRYRHRQASDQVKGAAPGAGDRGGQRALGPGGVGPEDDRRPQQVQLRLGGGGRLARELLLELRLFPGVEQVLRRACRPVLGHADGVVGVKAIGRHRGRVHEPLGPGVARGAQRIQCPLDVDGTDGLRAAGAGDHEGQVDDHVGAGERLAQRFLIAHVAPAVLHLVPALLGGVERPARDPDDPCHPRLRLQERHQAEPEGPGGAGDRHGQCVRSRGRHVPVVPAGRHREPPRRV